MSVVPLTATKQEVLSAIPDSPLSAEGRAMLLRGNAVAFAGDNASDWILCDPVNHLIYLAGCPRAGLLRQALELFPDTLSVIASCEHPGAMADVLTGWTC